MQKCGSRRSMWKFQAVSSRKNGLGRRDRVQGIAKLDHPVSRERAGKNQGDRGPCKLGCTQTITSGVRDDRGPVMMGPGRPAGASGWSRMVAAGIVCATQPFGASRKPDRRPGRPMHSLLPSAIRDGRRAGLLERTPRFRRGPNSSARSNDRLIRTDPRGRAGDRGRDGRRSGRRSRAVGGRRVPRQLYPGYPGSFRRSPRSRPIASREM